MEEKASKSKSSFLGFRADENPKTKRKTMRSNGVLTNPFADGIHTYHTTAVYP